MAAKERCVAEQDLAELHRAHQNDSLVPGSAPAAHEVPLTREERLKLSWRIFSDRDFRERLLTNPTTAGAAIGLRIPIEEHRELLHYREELQAYGAAIDTLVRLGKDVKSLWGLPDLGVLGINSVASPGDYDPSYPERDDGLEQGRPDPGNPAPVSDPGNTG